METNASQTVQKLRVLVSAYSCEPGRGSEPGIGWNWVKQAARFHDVWAITRANNRAAIEQALNVESIPNLHFIYYDTPAYLRFWKRGVRNVHLYYYIWQLGAYRVARKVHQQLSFDVVHHVTFGAYWMPTLLSKLKIPFIWGPVGGGESVPAAFRSSFSLRGRVFELSRDLARFAARVDPFVRRSARRASLTLATSSETESRLVQLGCRTVSVTSQVGLPAEEINQLSSLAIRTEGPFRVISVGRLLHWKGFGFGLRAFAEFLRSCPESEYWIIGDGPEEHRLRMSAQKLGISDRVRVQRPLPRQEVLRRLQECDVLLHPSMHDSGAWVCLEAMAAGRPVVCFDLGGPGLIVTEDTGIKVPAVRPAQAVAELSAALLLLAEDASLRWRLGRAARLRVQAHFGWGAKGDLWTQVFNPAAGKVSI